MLAKKLPETNEERISILRTILKQEEINEGSNKVLSMVEFQELSMFTNSFEAVNSLFGQAIVDKEKAKASYKDLFNNAQLYISHFIQVLFLTVIRNEIKAENLALYGFQENNPVLPNLSTEENILQWGENLLQGEAERTYKGGIPLYNPAIAKVKVHYELFKECIYSLTIYEKNIIRLQSNMDELSIKSDELISDIWTKVETQYAMYSPDEQAVIFKNYRIFYIYKRGDQLNVFDI